MGVHGVWAALQAHDAVTDLSGDKGRILDISRLVDGKVLAVDLSVWIFEAMRQGDLMRVFDSEEAQCLKLVFERISMWLRFGVLPVFVVEGRAPVAKLGTMRQRAGDQAAAPAMTQAYNPAASMGQGGEFAARNRLITQMLDALGIPWVQATGEAEATCAALTRSGAVDGCQTKDVDSLLFGAEEVYKELRLAEKEQGCRVQLCRMEAVRQVLGLGATHGSVPRGTGHRSLIAMAQLIGGDYHQGGASGVGPAGALHSVKALLQRDRGRGKDGHGSGGARESDERVIELLAEALSHAPDQHLLSLNHCTGCKTCGHESGTRSSCQRHSRAGCAACGTLKGTVGLGAATQDEAEALTQTGALSQAGGGGRGGGGGCISRQFERCECEFHRREAERHLERVLQRARQTRDFTAQCERAAAAYLHQVAAAARATAHLTKDSFRWLHRPNTEALMRIICPHLWSPKNLALKLMPLFLEWDVRQGPQRVPPTDAAPEPGVGDGDGGGIAGGRTGGSSAGGSSGGMGGGGSGSGNSGGGLRGRPDGVRFAALAVKSMTPPTRPWLYLLKIGAQGADGSFLEPAILPKSKGAGKASDSGDAEVDDGEEEDGEGGDTQMPTQGMGTQGMPTQGTGTQMPSQRYGGDGAAGPLRQQPTAEEVEAAIRELGSLEQEAARLFLAKSRPRQRSLRMGMVDAAWPGLQREGKAAGEKAGSKGKAKKGEDKGGVKPKAKGSMAGQEGAMLRYMQPVKKKGVEGVNAAVAGQKVDAGGTCGGTGRAPDSEGGVHKEVGGGGLGLTQPLALRGPQTQPQVLWRAAEPRERAVTAAGGPMDRFVLYDQGTLPPDAGSLGQRSSKEPQSSGAAGRQLGRDERASQGLQRPRPGHVQGAGLGPGTSSGIGVTGAQSGGQSQAALRLKAAVNDILERKKEDAQKAEEAARQQAEVARKGQEEADRLAALPRGPSAERRATERQAAKARAKAAAIVISSSSSSDEEGAGSRVQGRGRSRAVRGAGGADRNEGAWDVSGLGAQAQVGQRGAAVELLSDSDEDGESVDACGSVGLLAAAEGVAEQRCEASASDRVTEAAASGAALPRGMDCHEQGACDAVDLQPHTSVGHLAAGGSPLKRMRTLDGSISLVSPERPSNLLPSEAPAATLQRRPSAPAHTSTAVAEQNDDVNGVEGALARLAARKPSESRGARVTAAVGGRAGSLVVDLT